MRKVAALLLAVGIVGSIAPHGAAIPTTGEGCDPRSVANLVRAFVRAYNRGDTETLDSIWAAEPDFEWYSVSPGERERDDAYERQTLIPYFEKRHQLGDRLALTMLRVGSEDGRGHFGIGFRVRRESQQAKATGGYHGKASAKEVMTLTSGEGVSLARCVLVVWSMGKE